MNILIITDLPEVGGSSTICLTLMRKFALWGYKVTVLARWHRGYKVSEGVLAECKNLGIEVLWTNNPDGCYGPGSVGTLWHLVQNVRPDVLLANGTGWLASFMALLIPSAQVVYYYINHDERAAPFRRLRWFSLFADRFAVITPISVAPLKSSIYIKRPVCWLPQFSEPVNCELAIPLDIPAAKGGVNVGFVGLLSEPKGVLHLLKLWPSLGLPGKLLFVGNGPCIEEVKQAEKDSAGKSTGIYYEGAFDPRDRDIYLKNFFGKIDFLVMPSIADGEGAPTVILEALAFGVPVLATDKGGTACFNIPWLAAPAACIVEAVPLQDLGPAIMRYSRAVPFAFSHRKKVQSYFKTWYSDGIVGSKWDLFIGNKFKIV